MTDDEKVTHESEHECPLPTEWPEQPKDATARLPYCKVCGTIHILLAGKGWHKIVPVEQHYSPPSAPHGDGGGVVNPESAEGASSNTPEEPCRRIVLNGHYDDGGPSRTIIYCGTHEQPIDTCRVVVLEAEVERWKDTAEERLELLQCGSCIAILFHGVDNTDCPSHDRKAAKACGEVSLSEVVQDSAEVARLRPVAEKATLEAELAVRGCWLCGDTGRAVKWEDGAALETDVPCPACRVRELEDDIKENYQLYRVGLRVEKDCIEELEAEVATLREALQIASDMFCGEGWTEAEQGRIAQVRAALQQAPAATSIDAHCTCHADYYERGLIDPACGLEGTEHHRRDDHVPKEAPK